MGGCRRRGDTKNSLLELPCFERSPPSWAPTNWNMGCRRLHSGQPAMHRLQFGRLSRIWAVVCIWGGF